ncbi:hypothetical protein R1flu_003407 [Riccia fluitans]|uniref:Uncharacterized protein n=1 Tax=Riccia fluitans TaxID=41844 RepID=A0ABD1Y8X1_9MARC
MWPTTRFDPDTSPGTGTDSFIQQFTVCRTDDDQGDWNLSLWAVAPCFCRRDVERRKRNVHLSLLLPKSSLSLRAPGSRERSINLERKGCVTLIFVRSRTTSVYECEECRDKDIGYAKLAGLDSINGPINGLRKNPATDLGFVPPAVYAALGLPAPYADILCWKFLGGHRDVQECRTTGICPVDNGSNHSRKVDKVVDVRRGGGGSDT